ncbi:sulfite exporter TauE/SafE family protein [Aestuariicoccus sp. MJ-SS9]|uniref:sulfite exporter TauE/SafE family protein n=1 Tax=Aestuariicoccus sp. MJ-SS9 TaxID=3079855 RepID=UPI002906DDB0|nr:sulfite exporter TauE/SafE family protein [Aestuariicoccus sp. MJ-SS9]MDU8911925.1 sulfite exporter TauE/SafE family protein [Aestuariicoccus sp. MJ-SS9]
MSADLFHAGLGWPIAATLAAVSFASSFITVAFGIGGGAVMLAVLAVLLPAAAIIPVHGLVQVGSNAGRLAIMTRYVHGAVVPAFLIGALIGVGLGGATVVQLPAGAIQLGVGLFILWSVFFRPPALMRRSAALTGVISSFLTMFFGGTGPFVAAFVRGQELDRMSHVATHAALMTIQHVLKVAVFGLLGFVFSQWIGFVALLIAAGFLGTLVGRQVLARIDERLFGLVLRGVLTLLALRLIWSGGTALAVPGG